MRTVVRGLVGAVMLALVAGFGVAHGQAQPLCVAKGAVPSGNPGLARDCATLLHIKNELRGTSYLNWFANRPIGYWEGVRLGGTPKRVTVLKVQRKDLNGSIPAGIGMLDKLVDLWAYHNHFQGPLPAELGNLSNLRTLMLGWNNLSGEIPSTLNNLTLERLWLRENDFTGCVPHKLSLVPENDLSLVPLPVCEAEESLSDMVQRVRPAVVKVYTSYRTGTGIIFRTDTDGAAYILTSQSVVDEVPGRPDYGPLDGGRISVTVGDYATYNAELMKLSDHRRDLAMLRICCGGFQTLDFADSDTLHPGDEVVAIGYSWHVLPRTFRPGWIDRRADAMVTKGIISAFGYDPWMDSQVVQHDATVSPFGSGGAPVLTLDGRVVGLTTYAFHERPWGEEAIVEGMSLAILETTVQERVRLWDLGPSAEFGPLSGSLIHGGETAASFSPEFTATDDEYAVEVTFTNPYEATGRQGFDYGFYLGRTDDPEDRSLAFVVASGGDWVLLAWVDGVWQRMHSGVTYHLNNGGGEKNHLAFYVDGWSGDFYVNGRRVWYLNWKRDDLVQAKRVNLGVHKSHTAARWPF